jgi:hypothetical protein
MNYKSLEKNYIKSTNSFFIKDIKIPIGCDGMAAH